MIATATEQLPQLAPMLLDEFVWLPDHTQADVLVSPRWIAQEKHDGVRAKLHIGADGNRIDGRRVSIRTGNLSEFTDNLPHLASLRLPGFEGLVLDGELVTTTAGRSSWRDVSAVLHSTPARARALQADKPLQFVAFDVVGTGSYRERYAQLTRLWAVHGERLAAAGVHLVGCRTDKAALHAEVLARGGEGVVLKSWTMAYEPGHRSRGCLKWK